MRGDIGSDAFFARLLRELDELGVPRINDVEKQLDGWITRMLEMAAYDALEKSEAAAALVAIAEGSPRKRRRCE